MAADNKEKKQKLLQKADELARERKLKKAISIYRDVIAADPNDIKTRLRLSELMYQAQRPNDALAELQFVGDYYREHGFLLKSVAVYKKMLEVDQTRTELHGVLAQLYFQLGMAPDAIRQFKSQIRALLKQGRDADSLYVIRSMLELDPANVSDRLRLAENFSSKGLIDEAATEYRRVVGILEKSGRDDQWAQVALRYLHHNPEDFTVRKKVVEHLAQKGDHHRALQQLHACLLKDPLDHELLELAATCFEAMGQIDKAIVTWKSLIPLYRQQGLTAEEQDTWIRVLELDPKDDQALKAVDRDAAAPAQPVEVELEWDMPVELPAVEEADEAADTVYEDAVSFASELADESTSVQPISEDLLRELSLEQTMGDRPARPAMDLASVARALRARQPLTAPQLEKLGIPLSDADREELDFFLSAGLAEEALSILHEIHGRLARGGG